VQADAAVTSLPADARRALDSRFRKLEQMAAFASRLLKGDAPVGATLVLPSDQDQEAIAQKVVGKDAARQAITKALKSIRVGTTFYPLSGLPESGQLAKLPASGSLPRLEFFTTAGPKSVADAAVEPGPAWGVLRLLQQPGTQRRADGKEWDTIIRVNNKGTELVLPVTISLEQGLPPADQWPAH